MNCDFIDLKQEAINCKGVNFGKSVFFSLVTDGLLGYLATYSSLLCQVGYQRAIYCW